MATLDLTRTVNRARKARAHSIALASEAETPKAAKRAQRRAKAARRAQLDAMRGADAWREFLEA